MFPKSILYSCLIVFATISLVQAQDTHSWTLQQCIDYAIKNNIQVKQSELNAQTEKYSLDQTEANVLPSLNGNASHGYNVGKRVDPFTNKFADKTILSQNFSLGGSLLLFSGLQNYNAIKSSQYNYMAQKFDVDKAKNTVALSITTAYLQVLFNEELASIAKNQATVTKKQEEQTNQLVEVGKLAKGGLLDIQAQLALDELNVVTTQNQLDLSYLTLVQFLNLDSVDGFTITKPEITLPANPALSTTASQLYLVALSTMPQIKSAELRFKSAEKNAAASKGNISPKLSLNGALGTGYSALNTDIFTGETKPYFNQYKENSNKNLGLSLSIPLFNGLQTRTAIGKAKIQSQQAAYSLELVKLELKKTIQQAHADANAALKKYYATLKAHDAITESFKYAEQKFNLGAVNSLEYVTAKGKLLKAQSDLLQAKYDYIFKTKVLDFYQGKSIAL